MHHEYELKKRIHEIRRQRNGNGKGKGRALLAIEDKPSSSNQVEEMYKNQQWLAGSHTLVASSSLCIGHFSLAAVVLPSTWILDSGASHHMHNGNDFITDERLSDPIQIQLGDKTCVLVTHHGSIRVQNHQFNALHTPSFRYSLLLVAELDSQGYHTKFDNGKCSIQNSKDSLVTVMTGSRSEQLYQVDPIPRSIQFVLLGSANLFLTNAESHLWHKRLAHLNHVSMKSLVDSYIPTV
jgi:hypothetical protein